MLSAVAQSEIAEIGLEVVAVFSHQGAGLIAEGEIQVVCIEREERAHSVNAKDPSETMM